MGRQLKRVPLDFKWPIHQVWKGFINPYSSIECKDCEGTGYNQETLRIDKEWYAFDNPDYEWIVYGERRYNKNAHCNNITQIELDALLEKGRLRDLTESGNIPTLEDVNKRNKLSLGHDVINKWICVEALAKSKGVYGKCEICGGDGEIWFSDNIKKLSEEWEPQEPPTGKGFQLWENTSEGSPISPVFDDIEKLCEYVSENCSVFANEKVPASEWLKMLTKDFVHYKKDNYIFI